MIIGVFGFTVAGSAALRDPFGEVEFEFLLVPFILGDPLGAVFPSEFSPAHLFEEMCVGGVAVIQVVLNARPQALERLSVERAGVRGVLSIAESVKVLERAVLLLHFPHSLHVPLSLLLFDRVIFLVRVHAGISPGACALGEEPAQAAFLDRAVTGFAVVTVRAIASPLLPLSEVS